MKTRYVINVQGTPRTVISVHETKAGTLLITYPSGSKAYSAPTLNEMIAVSDYTLYENCAKHISIHPSPESQTLTTIKRTIEYPDIYRINVTKASLQTIFGSRCGVSVDLIYAGAETLT